MPGIDITSNLDVAVRYEKTADPNIIKRIETVETEIHLDKLEKQVSALEAEIAAVPAAKTKPDQETLEFWNGHVRPGMSEIAADLDRKAGLLRELKSLAPEKAVKVGD